MRPVIFPPRVVSVMTVSGEGGTWSNRPPVADVVLSSTFRTDHWGSDKAMR
jgi:hypothetical protein